MVPGSTFRYGSNFWSETVRPRLSSRQPIDAAAMPLPREETTPPVTKMNLAIHGLCVRRLDRGARGADQFANAFEVFGSVHTERFVVRFHYPDLETVFESPELFQPFGP